MESRWFEIVGRIVANDVIEQLSRIYIYIFMYRIYIYILFLQGALELGSTCSRGVMPFSVGHAAAVALKLE